MMSKASFGDIVPHVEEQDNNNNIAIEKNDTHGEPLRDFPVRIVQKRKLFNIRTIGIITIWYLFSFVAIFLSKYAVDVYQIDLLLFSGIQLGISASMAYAGSLLNQKKEDDRTTSKDGVLTNRRDFYFSLFFIGLLRLLVIYLGLVSMKYVALSFMETVKSSAPMFTVLISFIILKERNGFLVQISILPIMLGLFLCSAYEISFTWTGFISAMGANVAECPSEFQLLSSLTGVISIIPLSLFVFDFNAFVSTNFYACTIMLLVGICYFLQTLMAWILMEFISPVTHSICNTVKCGVAVWLSVPIFGNFVTLWSGVGSCLVITGVILYQKARNFEKRSPLLSSDSAAVLTEMELCIPSNVDLVI